jgi:ubiquinol-cytochrome c reductase cytochrome b subunit
MMIMVVFHLLRQILLGGYKSPREGTWLVGVPLFFGVLFLAYSGYLLRWDERSIYGIRVMLQILGRVPLVGDSLVLFAQGGPSIGPATLARLYAFHVLVIPLIMFALVGFHLYLVVIKGTMTKGERSMPVRSVAQQREIYKSEAASLENGETFFPFTMLKTGTMAGIVIGLTLAAAVFLGPSKLYSEANFTESTMPAEEWWYWWLSGLIALLPPSIAPWAVVLLPIAVLAFLLALPFVDRSPLRGARNRPVWIGLVIATVITILLLTDYRRRSPFTAWPNPRLPVLPAGMTLPPEAEQGRMQFARYGCNSCHAVGKADASFAVDFALLRGQLSREKIREYILNPPAGIAMPSYEGRMTDAELNSVVAFCHVVQTFPRED